jgi:hypothetical protein
MTDLNDYIGTYRVNVNALVESALEAVRVGYMNEGDASHIIARVEEAALAGRDALDARRQEYRQWAKENPGKAELPSAMARFRIQGGNPDRRL